MLCIIQNSNFTWMYGTASGDGLCVLLTQKMNEKELCGRVNFQVEKGNEFVSAWELRFKGLPCRCGESCQGKTLRLCCWKYRFNRQQRRVAFIFSSVSQLLEEVN